MQIILALFFKNVIFICNKVTYICIKQGYDKFWRQY